MKFPGISADARTLGLSASYLWRCLTGRVTCQKIVSDYWELKKAQARRFLSKAQKSTASAPDPAPQEKVNA